MERAKLRLKIRFSLITKHINQSKKNKIKKTEQTFESRSKRQAESKNINAKTLKQKQSFENSNVKSKIMK